MTKNSLHPFDADATPELYDRDIPWGRYGMSIGRVEDAADVETLRLMLSEALTLLARMTVQHDRAGTIIVALREELRRYVLAQMEDAA